MERISCGIMQDLLVSYADGLTGEEVTCLLQEHLEECPGCQQYYEEIKKQQEAEQEASLSKGMVFGEKLKELRYYMIGIFIGLMIPIAIIVLFFAVGAIMSYVESMVYSYQLF